VILDDVEQSAHRLEAVWAASEEAGWPHADLGGGDDWPVPESPVHRLREVEMHHVDLGAGYEPPDWPPAYVAWELRMLVADLPDRVGRPEDRRDLVAWLSGRAPIPQVVELEPW
jgi:maleylpyruvate isomerase